MLNFVKTSIAIVVVAAIVSTESRIVQLMNYDEFPNHITNYNSQTTLCKPVTPPCIICTTPSVNTFHVCSDPAVTFKYECPDRTSCKPYNPCTRPNTTKRKCTTCATTKVTRCTCPSRATTPPTSCQSCQYKYENCEYNDCTT